MATVITVLIVLAGLINFLPLAGILGASQLQTAYALDFSEPNLQILMRHRALLFGLLGGFMLYAAYAPMYRPAAYVMGLISMLGFLLLYWQVGEANAALKKIAWADVLGLVALSAAMLLDYARRSG